MAIYYREILILKQRFFRQLASMSVMPLLYMVAFGYGVGEKVTVDGVNYMSFMIPGLLAMNSMVQGFSIAAEINIARFYKTCGLCYGRSAFWNYQSRNGGWSYYHPELVFRN
jgi:hypothetical protein